MIRICDFGVLTPGPSHLVENESRRRLGRPNPTRNSLTIQLLAAFACQIESSNLLQLVQGITSGSVSASAVRYFFTHLLQNGVESQERACQPKTVSSSCDKESYHNALYKIKTMPYFSECTETIVNRCKNLFSSEFDTINSLRRQK